MIHNKLQFANSIVLFSVMNFKFVYLIRTQLHDTRIAYIYNFISSLDQPKINYFCWRFFTGSSLTWCHFILPYRPSTLPLITGAMSGCAAIVSHCIQTAEQLDYLIFCLCPSSVPSSPQGHLE